MSYSVLVFTFAAMEVRAKKALGQHFLKDTDIAFRIVDSLRFGEASAAGMGACAAGTVTPSAEGKTGESRSRMNVLEVGPGTGVLTQFLVKREDILYKLIEIDSESVDYLRVHYPFLGQNLIYGDFLKMNPDLLFADEPFCIIGNFPYNISSQIFFRVLDYRERIPQVVGMVQKEVAERLASAPGSKVYGILSVLLQAWYDIEYLFTVPEHVFLPPPKVKSAVIRLVRNSRTDLGCDEVLFKKIIKSCFNQRRKTIRNSIKSALENPSVPLPDHRFFSMRPEQLGVEDFIELTRLVSGLGK